MPNIRALTVRLRRILPIKIGRHLVQEYRTNSFDGNACADDAAAYAGTITEFRIVNPALTLHIPVMAEVWSHHLHSHWQQARMRAVAQLHGAAVN